MLGTISTITITAIGGGLFTYLAVRYKAKIDLEKSKMKYDFDVEKLKDDHKRDIVVLKNNHKNEIEIIKTQKDSEAKLYEHNSQIDMTKLIMESIIKSLPSTKRAIDNQLSSKLRDGEVDIIEYFSK